MTIASSAFTIHGIYAIHIVFFFIFLICILYLFHRITKKWNVIQLLMV